MTAKVIKVNIVPNSRLNQIVGWKNGELKIRIKALPEHGKANEELIRFLAEQCQMSKSDIEIISGHTSRKKLVRLSSYHGVGIPEEEDICLR